MTIDLCPRCNARLPRRLHFTHPDEGPALLFAGIATAAGTMGLIFAILHTIIWPETPLNRVGMGAALYGILWTEFGLSVSIFRYWRERHEPWDAPHTMEQGQAADRIVPVERTPTSARSLVRPAAPAGINEYQAWVMLTAIARYDDVTFSEETARDYSAVSNREDYRRLLRWLVDEGLYVTARDDPYDNGSGGDITDYCRELLSPAPEGALANTDERPPGTDEPTARS